jgi:hypothetical protein
MARKDRNRHAPCEMDCNTGLDAPKCDSFRMEAPMVNEDRPDEAPSVQPASVALVPMGRIERRSRRRWYRWAPDPVFVAHLIAEAQQVPQARRIRRASLVDAQAAYRTRQMPTPGAGNRLRQVI